KYDCKSKPNEAISAPVDYCSNNDDDCFPFSLFTIHSASSLITTPCIIGFPDTKIDTLPSTSPSSLSSNKSITKFAPTVASCTICHILSLSLILGVNSKEGCECHSPK